ncbi:MAG: hypothetical protein AB8I08_16955 [Sandaracinaceae bacterium]
MKMWFGLSVVLLVGGCGSSSADPASPAAASSEEPGASTEVSAAEQVETTEATPTTLIGEWSVDPECIPRQRGMEGADEATVQAVAAQMAGVRYRYTETDFESHNPALPRPVVQPYTVLSHEGATWTYELAGPTGAPMQITAVLDDGQLQLRREDALELCLRPVE